ncbi:MAG: hypothetical protein V2A34_06555, partial [Lentisphaerota bacterium]
MLPFTQKKMMDWSGATAFRDGQTLFERGLVQGAEYDPPYIRGTLTWGNRAIRSAAKILPDGTCENMCPCRDSTERGIVCPHVIAIGIALLRQATDPDRERKRIEETRRAARLSALDESQYLRRAGPGDEGGVDARLQLELGPQWAAKIPTGKIPLICLLEMRNQLIPLDQAPRDVPLRLTPKDESLLFVLEDIFEGPARGGLDIVLQDLLNLLELHAGKPLYEAGRPEPFIVNASPMQSILRLDLDHENGELLLIIHTELPFVKAGEFPVYLVASKKGW